MLQKYLRFILFGILHAVTSDDWVTDSRTRKQYLVLEADDILNHEVLRRKCLNNGGFLPEPKDKHDYRFLLILNTSTFVLGLTKEEGSWLWETDDRPVKWFNWAATQAPGPDRHCVTVDMSSDGETGKWTKFPCEGVDHDIVKAMPKSLICQSNPAQITTTPTTSTLRPATTTYRTTNITTPTSSISECPNGYEWGPKGCQDIDECKLKGREACKKENICHNQVGTYTCESIHENEESVHNQICVHKIPNVTKSGSGRDQLLLPPNPQVAAGAITLSGKVIAFLLYVFVMMLYTVVKSIYLHCMTESWPPPKYWIENKKKGRKGCKEIDEYKSN